MYHHLILKLVEMQNGIASLEDKLAAFYKVKQVLAI